MAQAGTGAAGTGAAGTPLYAGVAAVASPPGGSPVTASLLLGAAPGPTTTAPGSVVTIVGGPYSNPNVTGPHSDPFDFYGPVIALAAVVVAITLARLVFSRRGRDSHVEGPR